ncbi:MAG: hypothetical protein KIT15_03440 [Xanthobacteraceae bacterium]|nr:hypothetical protein [Xanthobacteraceae bacterium]MCW5673611.1 hypothetical protein [Xanthobacteraceae bacterium]
MHRSVPVSAVAQKNSDAEGISPTASDTTGHVTGEGWWGGRLHQENAIHASRFPVLQKGFQSVGIEHSGTGQVKFMSFIDVRESAGCAGKK